MQHWMCITCGTQFAASENQPATCPICADQRQYIRLGGQKWTTLEAMQGGNYKNSFKEYEPNVTGIGTEPTFAIGQRALLVQTGHGNVLWDCISYVDDATVAALQQRGVDSGEKASSRGLYRQMGLPFAASAGQQGVQG